MKIAVRIMVVSAIAVAMLLVSACSENQGQTWSPQGRIVFLEGSVTVDGSPADIGSEVTADSRIVTDAQSYIEIEFGSANIIRIEPSSDVSLALSRDAASEISIQSGAFAAVLDGLNRLDGDSAMRVRSRTMIAGIRGTSFYVSVEEPETTYFCLCNGAIELGGTGSDVQAVDAAHHQAFRLIDSGNGIEMVSAPLLYHSDDTMEALAARINAEIDWDIVGGAH